MGSRAFVASVLFAGMLVTATFAMSGDDALSHQSAIVKFERPTWVAGQVLVGTYVIVHDEDKMARGEPCTSFYRVGTGNRPLEEVVSFHCIPRERAVVPSFTTTIRPAPALSIDAFDTLVEYQFAGDPEGHGVPMGLPQIVSDWSHAPGEQVCAR